MRAERERLGVSQEELADRSGLHRTYIGGVERGERNLGLLNVLRLARALLSTSFRNLTSMCLPCSACET